MNNNGARTTEKQGDWTVYSVMNDYLSDGKLSRRKKAFMLSLIHI